MKNTLYLLVLMLALSSLLVGLDSAGGATPTINTYEDQRCFPETGHCIDGRIREFWEQNGDLAIFGRPITPLQHESIAGNPYQVQWFERMRLELHAEEDPPNDIRIGQLGLDVLEQQGRDWRQFPTSEPQDDCRYDSMTHHRICGAFLEYWQSHGLDLGVDGEAVAPIESYLLFGRPLSEAITDTINGIPYQVQWFEHMRVELHPDLGPPFHILSGLLGTELRSAPPQPVHHRQILVFPDSRLKDLWLSHADGTGLTRLTRSSGDEYSYRPTWSPDGTRLAFVSTRDGYPAIYRINANGTGLTRLTDNPAGATEPVWSPDGTQIAYLALGQREQGGDVMVMQPDGSDPRRLTHDEGVFGFERLQWSPDGTSLSFERRARVFIMQADGTNFRQLTSGGTHIWSPDSTQLAIGGVSGGTLLIDIDGTLVRELPVGSPSDWSSDGERIMVGSRHLRTISSNGGDIRPLTENPFLFGASDSGGTWSPDGSRIAFTRTQNVNPATSDVVTIAPDGSYLRILGYGMNPVWQPLPPAAKRRASISRSSRPPLRGRGEDVWGEG